MNAQLELLPTVVEAFLEHHHPNEFPKQLDRWKQLEREGWDVTVLFELGGEELVALGCRKL